MKHRVSTIQDIDEATVLRMKIEVISGYFKLVLA